MKPVLAVFMVTTIVVVGALLAFPGPNQLPPNRDAERKSAVPAEAGRAELSSSPVTLPRESARTSVPVTEGAAPAYHAAGRAVLLDGSPVANCTLWAIDASAEAPSLDELRSGVPSHKGILAKVRTDADGGFDLAFAATTSPDQLFRIWHLLDGVPQADTVYRLATARQLEHRLPTGRIAIETSNSDGVAVADVLIWLRCADGSQRVGQTTGAGRCEFFLASPQNLDVLAYQSEHRIGAKVGSVAFDPYRRYVLQLQLQAMDTGSVRVEVVDQAGHPVPRFALRVRLSGRSIRLVSSEELRGGCLTGLPEAEVAIQLVRPYSVEPVLYEPPEQVERRLVAPDGSATPIVRFAVKLMSRLCFDLAAEGAPPQLSVHVRRSAATGAAEWRAVEVEQYLEKGATDSDTIRSAGRWFTKPLEPGYYELEVRRADSDEPVFREWVDLMIGATVVRKLEI